MSKYETYNHHGNEVMVRADLKGKHRDHCLCWSCAWFHPGDPHRQCPKAARLFKICVEEQMVTPVYECPTFLEKKNG